MLSGLQITDYYTPFTETSDVEDPVWKAWRTMKDLGVKRLPVLKNGKVVGVVTDRDIVQISGYNGGQSMPVQDAMSLDPLIVSDQGKFTDVLNSMIKKDQQYAVVVDDQNTVCGIFSWAKAFQFFLEFTDINNINQMLSS